jgi:hypothetical protein
VEGTTTGSEGRVEAQTPEDAVMRSDAPLRVTD